MIRSAAVVFVSIAVACANTSAQKAPASNAKALSYAAQSIAAMTQGSTISDVTLTGTATWTARSDTETGTATFLASGASESRITLALSDGTRTEIRDAQTGMTQGNWIPPRGASGKLALHNCQTDAVGFFPALSSLAPGPNVVVSYIGREDREGKSVEHVRSSSPHACFRCECCKVPCNTSRVRFGLFLTRARFTNRF
jgi:hypothetical protein